MKNKDLNIIYIGLAIYGAWYLYDKYKKNKATVAPVILNQPNIESPVQQVSATVEAAPEVAYNVKYKLSGFKKLPQYL